MGRMQLWETSAPSSAGSSTGEEATPSKTPCLEVEIPPQLWQYSKLGA